MAAPNIVNVANIQGRTQVQDLTTTTSNVVINAAASNTVVKVNTIQVTNIDGANSADVTVNVNDGTNTAPIASTIAVPADSTLVVTDKNSSFYLEEGYLISAAASANSDLNILVSYEIIS